MTTHNGIVSSHPAFQPQQQSDPSVLLEAHHIVRGPRRSNYGHPLDNFDRTARIWSAILGISISAEQVGWCMIGLKMAREIERPTHDNLVDAAGYVETIYLVQQERLRRAAAAIEASEEGDDGI